MSIIASIIIIFTQCNSIKGLGKSLMNLGRSQEAFQPESALTEHFFFIAGVDAGSIGVL